MKMSEETIIEFPFYYRENENDKSFELRKNKDDALIGTFESKLYADYITSLMNFADALGNQAKKLSEL
jgi:hypothetical protein